MVNQPEELDGLGWNWYRIHEGLAENSTQDSCPEISRAGIRGGVTGLKGHGLRFARAWTGMQGLSHSSGYTCGRKERKRRRKEKEEEERKTK